MLPLTVAYFVSKGKSLKYSSIRSIKKAKGTVKNNVFKSEINDEANNLSFSALKVTTHFNMWTLLIYNNWKQQIREHKVSQGLYEEVISFTRQMT